MSARSVTIRRLTLRLKLKTIKNKIKIGVGSSNNKIELSKLYFIITTKLYNIKELLKEEK